MKKLLFSLIAIIIVAPCFAQDTLVKKTGEVIFAKILEINPSDVKYTMFDYQDGPTFIESKSDIKMIRYKNGTQQTFAETIVSPVNNTIATTPLTPALSSDEMRIKGTKDAQRFYRGKNSGAGWTTALCIVLTPLAGLIPAVGCSTTPPNDRNLNYKSEDLMRNYDYSGAYKKQAHKIKKNKIWTNFAIGSGVFLALFMITNS